MRTAQLTSLRQLDIAYEIASKAHEGQFRRDGVTPYFNHCMHVANIVQRRGGSDEDIAAALTHDVLEDTPVTKFDLLRAGLTQRVVDAVMALTKLDGECYEQAVLRAKANPIARKVKIADNLANLSDEPTDKQIMKYSKSLQVLMSES